MTSLILAAALTLQVPSAPWLNGGKAPDAPENISQGFDWMNDSGLRCPVYDEGGNILMNPSFEGGRRYWRVQGNAMDVEDFYVTWCVREGTRCALPTVVTTRPRASSWRRTRIT